MKRKSVCIRSLLENEKKREAHVDYHLETGCIHQLMSCFVEGMFAFMKGSRRTWICDYKTMGEWV